MTLSDNIHQLTNQHMTQADDGSFVIAQPLLEQLREACTSNHGAAGGGGGGAGMMVNSAAVKLDTKIKEDALFEHFEMAGSEYRGQFTALIKTWPLINLDDWQEYLGQVTLNWVNDIRAILTSKRPPWRPTLNCPSCGHRFHGPEREPNLWVEYWDHDNEKMAHPSQWSAGCDGCGAHWDADNLKWLRAASDTRTIEVAQVS